ncbi:mannose-P-dolichol utilization defect 1 protein-like isoform X1 [Scleropages formosus]|uniref:Mannose-P-dolichol utilization defect 1 protein homolog n=2 Tax=Scleropages formosus TaxID=113540 RepID=A0A8C9SL63_SCLFO|nr:mannose-P-dolichol utilization defect 1 protein-like isoform X1 [Scleropages formosus]
MDALRSVLLAFVMPEKCYQELFVKLNLFHVPCVRVVLRRTLGIWIMLGSVTVKLPQIFKMMRAKSADALSFPSVLVELCIVTGTLADRIARNFPIDAWGDVLFILIQTVTIGFLIQHYRGHTGRGLLFLVVYSSLALLLTSPLVPKLFTTTVQASSTPALVAARLLQVWTCYRSGHTGQLSAPSVFLLFVGSLAHALSIFVETGDYQMTLPYIIIFCSNGLLACQMLCYWRRAPALKTKAE